MSTPDRILAAARSCLLRLGYPRTTVKAIAEEAGVNPGLIHHHFGSKENLFCAVMDALNEEIQREMESRPSPARMLDKKDFKNTIQVHFRLFVEFNAMAPHMPEVAKALKKFIHKRKENLKNKNQVETDGEAFFMMSFIVGMSVLSIGYPGLPMQDIQKHLLRHFPDFFNPGKK